MTNVIGVVLAGGKSSRMGQDKAKLPFQDSRFVDQAVTTLMKANVQTVYVSGAELGYPMISDKTPHKGPVGGICASVLELEADALLFIPVDMPLLTAECIMPLLENKSSCHFENYTLPLLLYKTESVIDKTKHILSRLEQNESCSIRGYLLDIGAVSTPLPEELLPYMANINTQEEWRLIHHEFKNR